MKTFVCVFLNVCAQSVMARSRCPRQSPRSRTGRSPEQRVRANADSYPDMLVFPVALHRACYLISALDRLGTLW